MSIQDSGGGRTYSDHDVHHVRHRVRLNGATGGDNLSQVSDQQFEITERGLDPDELAELKAMRVSVGVDIGASEAQDSRGEVSYAVEAGYNTQNGETIRTASASPAGDFDPDGDGTDEISVFVSDTDEVGQIYTLADNANIGYDDDANGNGGGGANNVVTETLNMDELFGSGPFVDSADDFVSTIRIRPDNVIEQLEVDVVYSLYYNVSVTEGGRSRFGR